MDGVLGVAQSREETGDAGDQETQRHGRPGVERGDGAGQHENAGTDGVADAEGRKVQDPERSTQGRVVTAVRFLRSVSIDFRDHAPMCEA